MTKLEIILRNNEGMFSPILPVELLNNKHINLNLSKSNTELGKYDNLDTKLLSDYINSEIQKSGKSIALGGYDEDRIIYKKSGHFGNDKNARTIHLGIDIWCDFKTLIYSPFDAEIHSYKDNNNFGDYGPTIILKHKLEGEVFYTLYGHLSGSPVNRLLKRSIWGAEVPSFSAKNSRTSVNTDSSAVSF